MMKYSCEIVQDLLPLYQDEICSDASREMVQEHLIECEDCRNIAEKLKDTEFDAQLRIEKEEILTYHKKQVNRKTFVAGAFMAVILIIPTIICLICNIAVGHGLDWFFIVLASLLVVASITVVPLIIEEKRWIWTLASFTGSLLLLLLICCLYSGGDWFFIAAFAVLLGVSVVVLPFILHGLDLPECMAESKGLIVMCSDTFFLYGLIVVIGFSMDTPSYWKNALLITSSCLLFIWVLFFIIRYSGKNGWIKAGTCILLGGIYIASINDIIFWILEEKRRFTIQEVDLSVWREQTISPNICFIILCGGVAAGLIFMLFGIIRAKKQDKKQDELK